MNTREITRDELLMRCDGEINKIVNQMCDLGNLYDYARPLLQLRMMVGILSQEVEDLERVLVENNIERD